MTELVCLRDYEHAALKRLPKAVSDFFRSGGEFERSLQDNKDAFKRYRLLPRVMKDVSSVDMTTNILGHKIGFPVGIAPTGTHEMAHPGGELATATAAGVMDTIFTVSTFSNTSMEALATHAGGVNKLFQLYLTLEEDATRPVTRALLDEAEAAGFLAVVVTVDTPVLGRRWDNMRNNFSIPAHLKLPLAERSPNKANIRDITKFAMDNSLTWDIISWLKSATKLPIILKGIITPADAALAADHGVAAVWVSNHGGRQLDTVPATIDVLEPIVRAVAGRCEVYLDGGIRCGTDIFKALALGANAVFIGRPVMYGLTCGGMAGVRNVLDILKSELSVAMALSGCSKLSEISREHVIHQSEYSARL